MGYGLSQQDEFKAICQEALSHDLREDHMCHRCGRSVEYLINHPGSFCQVPEIKDIEPGDGYGAIRNEPT